MKELLELLDNLDNAGYYSCDQLEQMQERVAFLRSVVPLFTDHELKFIKRTMEDFTYSPTSDHIAIKIDDYLANKGE